MNYFPFFIDIEDKQVLIIGGGQVALRKVEKLLDFKPNLRVIAIDFCDELKNLAKEWHIELIQKEVEYADIKGAFCVIAATDNSLVNSKVSEWCKNSNIPVNVVDDIKMCSFIFPALVKKDNLCIGISTNGRNPESAKYIKEIILSVIPENISHIIELLSRQREKIKKNISDTIQRKEAFFKLSSFIRESKLNFSEQELNEFERKYIDGGCENENS